MQKKPAIFFKGLNALQSHSTMHFAIGFSKKKKKNSEKLIWYEIVKLFYLVLYLYIHICEIKKNPKIKLFTVTKNNLKKWVIFFILTIEIEIQTIYSFIHFNNYFFEDNIIHIIKNYNCGCCWLLLEKKHHLQQQIFASRQYMMVLLKANSILA